MKRKMLAVMALIMVSMMVFPSIVSATGTENAVSGNHAAVQEQTQLSGTDAAVEGNNTDTAAGEEKKDEEKSETGSAQTEGDVSEETVDAPAGGQPQEEPQAEPVEQEKNVSGGGALAVDGYYDDWVGVKETMISYGSHNAAGTVYEYHGGAMLVKDGYVYVYIRMSDLYQNQIPVDDLKLTINGTEKSFVIRRRNTDRTIDWNQDIYALSPGIHSNLGIFFRDGGTVALGEAAVTINEASPNDCFEFRMKISELEALYGFEEGTIENGAKMEFYSPNIGPEKITVVGSSTGTYIGIMLCVAVVLSAMLGHKRKQGHA